MLTIREVIKKIVVKQIIILIMMIIIRVLHWVLQSRYWPRQNGFRCYILPPILNIGENLPFKFIENLMYLTHNMVQIH
jgi:hypothetical protein